MAERSRAAATGFGAAAGGVAGVIAGLVALVIQGGAPIVAGTAIATVLTALGIGAVAGGLVAGVYSMGVSHEGIPLGEEAVRDHGVVAYSGEADHDSGLMAITVPGHADHPSERSDAGLLHDRSMIGISQSFPVF